MSNAAKKEYIDVSLKVLEIENVKEIETKNGVKNLITIKHPKGVVKTWQDHSFDYVKEFAPGNVVKGQVWKQYNDYAKEDEWIFQLPYNKSEIKGGGKGIDLSHIEKKVDNLLKKHDEIIALLKKNQQPSFEESLNGLPESPLDDVPPPTDADFKEESTDDPFGP